MAAFPTLQICLICFDADSTMSPIIRYNLKKAYENLTGHPLWPGGLVTETLCVQCAQRLRNFRRFREHSVRARSLMMELF